MDGLDTVASSGYLAVDGTFVALAPPPELPPDGPFPPEAAALVREAADLFNAGFGARRASTKDKRLVPDAIEKASVDAFIAVANGKRADVDGSLGRLMFDYPTLYMATFRRALDSPGVTLRHLLRLYVAEFHGFPPICEQRWGNTILSETLRTRARAELRDARTLVEMQATMGYTRDDVVRTILRDVPADNDPGLRGFVWPVFAAYPTALEEALGSRPSPDKDAPSTGAAMIALAMLPKTPQSLLEPLIRLAAAGTNGERRAARDLLADAPNFDDRIARLLDDGKQETRAGASAWLAERGAHGSTPALHAALARERSEPVRASILAALAKLGEDISSYVDEATLRAEAERGLAKTPPKNLDWFPFDVLPELHWASGAPVPREIVRWWIVLANKLKDPGRNPLFEFYFDRMDAEDVARFGTAILTAWIAYDTVHPTEAEAIAYAEERVDRQLEAIARHDSTMTRDRLFASLRSEMLAYHPNSAAENRGVLALVSRAHGAEAANAVRGYIKSYGGRTAQAKALLSALAANASPSAIQVVLANANRCKQRTVAEHAAALVLAIAEMRGWTPDELADNTIPTAGLDEDGILELDCGPERTFTARLDPIGRFDLFDASGKPAKTLPAARNEADAEPLAESKRTFAAANKEVAQIIELQTAVLYDAMCVQRSWPAAAWERLLNAHPIVRVLCRRVVWIVLDDTRRVVGSFRPRDDGTRANAAREPFHLDSEHRVGVAQSAVVSAELDAAWAVSLADSKITPLFVQFGRPTLEPDRNIAAARIDDRRGWCIERFRLRDAATKRGYRAGYAKDGGVFMEYVRTHPSVGLQAEIGFTGACYGLENGRAALTGLTFRKIARYGGPAVPLAIVPPVLLSECWNDLHEIAALGTGFDPAWETLTVF